MRKVTLKVKDLLRGLLYRLGLEVRRFVRYQALTEKPDIVVVGPYKLHNFGDDLIGLVIARQHQLQGNTVCIPGLSRENAREYRLWGHAIYGARVDPAKMMLIGGGGLLGDAGVAPKSEYLELGLSAAKRADQLGVDAQITGVGAGPLQVDAHKEIARDLVEYASHLGVRDPESYEFCVKELGVSKDKLTLGADLALLWPESLGVAPIRNGMVGLQCDIDDWLPAERARQVSQRFVKSARENADQTILVTPMRRSDITDALRETGIPQLRYEVMKDYLAVLSGMRAIVTSHLHLSIAAYAAGIPCFAVYVNDKTRRFYEQIGHPERAIPAATASDSEIDELLQEARSAKWTSADEDQLVKLKQEANGLVRVIVQ